MDRLKLTNSKSYDSIFGYPIAGMEDARIDRAKAFISRNSSLKYYIHLIDLSAKSRLTNPVDDSHCAIPS